MLGMQDAPAIPILFAMRFGCGAACWSSFVMTQCSLLLPLPIRNKHHIGGQAAQDSLTSVWRPVSATKDTGTRLLSLTLQGGFMSQIARLLASVQYPPYHTSFFKLYVLTRVPHGTSPLTSGSRSPIVTWQRSTRLSGNAQKPRSSL